MPIIAPLSAANKLRNQVLSVPGTVLIGQAGHPDKVIRLEHVPEYLNEFKKRGAEHLFINMDRGPDQEAWNTAMREVFSTARRDRPVPNPIPVSQDSHAEWAVSVDDVPLIENGIKVERIETTNIQTKTKPEIFKCNLCAMTWDSNRALAIHKGHVHKK